MNPLEWVLSIGLLISVVTNYYYMFNHATARELNDAYDKGFRDAREDFRQKTLAMDRGIWPNG